MMTNTLFWYPPAKAVAPTIGDKDAYDVHDSHGKIVGRIMLHPQAPKNQPWFWTIVAREIPPSVHNHGYSATREQAMADFKTRWAATTA